MVVKILSSTSRDSIVPSIEAFKSLTLNLKQAIADSVTVLIAVIDGKPMINIAVSDSLINSKVFHAGNLIKELAPFIKGGGGGQPSYASAGGTDVNGVDPALNKAIQILS